MAKRRKLEAPSAEELNKIEEGFARETSADVLGVRAPIAQIAGEAAALATADTASNRAAQAKDKADAERLRVALEKGLIVSEIPLSEISATELTRDRVVMDEEEMEELRQSIEVNGLRMPIEVFARPQNAESQRFGLISGYRRLAAIQWLYGATGKAEYATIKALVQKPVDAAAAYVAMVEENEIRSDLSHYERGRIAVMAAGQGAFKTIEDAVDKLFHTASKAKRSKIRSFANLHEDLGDLLQFPSSLTERSGLRLANAIRAGFTSPLRDALATSSATGIEQELKVLEPILKSAEQSGKDASRGGRPKADSPGLKHVANDLILADETAIRVVRKQDGFSLELRGSRVDRKKVDEILSVIAKHYSQLD